MPRISKFLKIVGLSTAMSIVSMVSSANTDLSDTVDASGLSGAYLAARVAMTDNDDEAAVAFYRRALTHDPDNAELKRNFFSALVSHGEIEDALKLAPEIGDGDNTASIAKLLQGIEALRQRSFAKVPGHLDSLKANDLEVLTAQILKAWSLTGEGKFDEALEVGDAINGPDWTTIIRDYHVGLMAALSGNDALATQRFAKVIENRAAASVLSATFRRAAEAATLSHLRLANAEAAKKAVDTGLEIFPSDPSLKAAAALIGPAEKPSPLITSPQAGGAELLFNIASAVGRDGGSAFAKTYLQMAEHLNPNMDVVALALGDILGRQQKYEQATEAYKRIGEGSSLYRQAQLGIGLNYDALENSEEAIAALKRMVDADPSDLIGYLTLGSVYHRKKEYREAADVYDRAVEKIGVPENYHWNLFYRRGMAYERLKEWEKAEPNFKLALELYPDQPDVLNYLGYTWIDMGINLEEGMEMIEKAVQLRPSAGYIIDSLGWAHYRLGNYDDAVVELERAVQIEPQDPTINDHLGDAYWRVGRKLEATFQWKIALSNDPDPEMKATIEEKLKSGLTTPPTPATAKTSEPEKPKSITE